MVDEWINKNYDNIKMWLQNILKDEDHSVRDDLFHEILITFMEHPQAEYMIHNNEARWFIVRVALNQSRSVNSKHYKLYKKYKNNRTCDIKRKYVKVRNTVTKILRSARINYYKDKFQVLKGNMKKTWNMINELLGVRQ